MHISQKFKVVNKMAAMSHGNSLMKKVLCASCHAKIIAHLESTMSLAPFWSLWARRRLAFQTIDDEEAGNPIRAQWRDGPKERVYHIVLTPQGKKRWCKVRCSFSYFNQLQKSMTLISCIRLTLFIQYYWNMA